MANWRRNTLALALPVLLAALGAGIADAAVYGELNLSAGYSDLDGWTSELRGGPRNSVGFEFYRKLKGDQGDVLTVDLQARLSHDAPSDAGDDWGIEIHNAWAERRLGLGRNVRFGHFSPSYGLEPEVDTHGTVLQTLAMEDIGFKKDWGLGYRQILGPYDLTVAGQLGSGMGIRTGEGSFLLTAQLWEPPGDGVRFGLSVLGGRILSGRGAWTLPSPDFGDEATSKLRAGAAALVSSGSFEYRGEVTAGANDDAAVAGALLQVGYVPPSLQSLTMELQARAWSGDLERSDGVHSMLTAGGSYELLRNWTLRAYLAADLAKPDGAEDTRLVLQAYYYGG